MPRARASAVGLRTDNDVNRQLTTDASFRKLAATGCRCNADDANDAMMNATDKRTTRRKRNRRGIFWNVGIGLSHVDLLGLLRACVLTQLPCRVSSRMHAVVAQLAAFFYINTFSSLFLITKYFANVSFF